jgi:diketogulonate reductase-like aldo/keto reductase
MNLSFKLNSGYRMPLVGRKYKKANRKNEWIIFRCPLFPVGTYLMQGTELTNKVIDSALKVGYRLFGEQIFD